MSVVVFMSRVYVIMIRMSITYVDSRSQRWALPLRIPHCIITCMKVTELRDALRACLRQTPWTQQEIARVAGLRQPAISRFLSGKSINAESAMRLWEFLQLPRSPDEVLPILPRLEALERAHIQLSEQVEALAEGQAAAFEHAIGKHRAGRAPSRPHKRPDRGKT